MSSKTPELIIFDMDGLLVSTEVVYRNGFLHAFEKNKLTFDKELVNSFAGQSWAASAKQLVQLTGDKNLVTKIRQEREDYIYKKLERDEIELKPFAREVLSQVKKTNLRIGLATSTASKRARALLNHFDLQAYFDYMVCVDQVEKAKPAPDLYLKNLALAQIPAAKALAVEDTLTGARAASAAGMPVILIPDSDLTTSEHIAPAVLAETKIIEVAKDLRAVMSYIENN